MTLQECKQYDRLLLDEINVNELERRVARTNRGDLVLVFNRETDTYFWRLDGTPITTDTPQLDAKIPELWQAFCDAALKPKVNTN